MSDRSIVPVLAVGGVLALVGVGGYLLRGRSAEPAGAAAEAAPAPPATAPLAVAPFAPPAGPPPTAPRPGAVAPGLSPAATSARAVAPAAPPTGPTGPVRIRGGRELARVNGVAITLRDLVPLRAADAATERSMSGEMYRSLLERAIERELVMEEARARKVTLDEAQARQIEALRARLARDDPKVFDGRSDDPDLVEFQVRDATGRMLKAPLAAMAGAPSPYVTEDHVRRYYDEHAGELDPLPADPGAREAAWRKIDAAIREKLAPKVDSEYQAWMWRYIEQLREAADVSVTPP